MGREGALAFLFPGEGSQYPGMLADLCPHFPELRAVFDTADRIARESGEEVPPSRHLFGSSIGPQALWATDTAVTAVLSSQWAMFQVLTRLGLVPTRSPAIAAANCRPLRPRAARTERTLERQLSRLAAIFRELEAERGTPSAAPGRRRDRSRPGRGGLPGGRPVCRGGHRQLPPPGRARRTPADVDLVVAQLRAAGVVCEELPFARAYHTPGFAAVLEPLAAFYRSLEMHPPECRSIRARRPAACLDLLTRSAAWRSRSGRGRWRSARHRGHARRRLARLRRRRGPRQLCGYVDDILRGRPAFAVAANLPRRSGTTQLNHLVASLFAQGLALDPGYLYARRQATARRPQHPEASSRPVSADREAEPLTRRIEAIRGLTRDVRLIQALAQRNGHQSRKRHVNGHEMSTIPTALANRSCSTRR